MKTKSMALVHTALASLVGVASLSTQVLGEKKGSDKDTELVKCYGVNSCSGKSKCSMGTHSCAGKNACAGQGWLPMPASSCLSITGGSLTPPKPPVPDEKLPGAPRPEDKKKQRY